jgi:TonB family protein
MIIKGLLSITTFLCFLSASGQDTIFFDSLWLKTTKESALFYRLITRDSVGFRFDDYYITGIVQMTGHSLSSDSLIKEGLFRYYFKDGKLSSEGNYANNLQTGKWKMFYPDGHLHWTANYTGKGKIDGEVTYFYPNGNVKRSDIYAKGKFRKGKCFTISGADTTWFPTRKNPVFKGGEGKMFKFIKENTIYPEYVKNLGIQGRVFVSFVVEVDGTLSEIKLRRGVYWLLDQEVLDMIAKMPPWEPGQLEGKPVRVQFNLPVSFRLE